MTTPDLSAFARYIPGFEFLQNLARQAAGGAAPGVQSGVPGMPPMSHWVAPTFDVEELDKRIQDLRAVHFWLDQNTKALAATIQALEVQKMTLATLKGMNVSLNEMADAFKIKPDQVEPVATPPFAKAAPAPAPAPQPAAPTPDETASAGGDTERPTVDPMAWWTSLTEQFQTIANGAMRDMADQASRAADQMTQTFQASAEAASQMAEKAQTAAPDSAAAMPARNAATRTARKASVQTAPRTATKAGAAPARTASRKTAAAAPQPKAKAAPTRRA